MTKTLITFIMIVILTLFFLVNNQSTINDLVSDYLNNTRNRMIPLVTKKRIVKKKNRPLYNMEYFHWKNEGACQTFYNIQGYDLKQRKGLDGNRTACMDPGLALNPKDCLVYSFGINNDWSFDEAMAKYGCQVYSFDPSLGLDNHSHSDRVHFFNLGLGTENLDRNRKGWRTATLKRIRQDLGHSKRNLDYLKMDIEGEEWPILRHLLDVKGLSNIKQLSMEIHLEDKPEMMEYRALMEELEQSGFVRFNSVPNIFLSRYYPKYGTEHSCYLEVSWYNSDFYNKTLKKQEE